MSRSFYVAGVKFHDLHKVINEIKVGMKLNILPDKDNPYDPNAIKITYKDTMLGFVPRKFSAEISGLFEIGEDVICEVEEVNVDAKPWEQLKVNVHSNGDISQ